MLKVPKYGKKSATKISPDQKPIEVKCDAVAAIKTEVKTGADEANYPNYAKSIEAVINATKEVKKSKPEPCPALKMNNLLPYQDHQYSRITFYGSGDTTETKATETAFDKVEKEPARPKVKQVRAKKPTFKKPQQPVQVIRPKPIIYRFKPSNGLLEPAYFVSSMADTSTNFNFNIANRSIFGQIQRQLPNIYGNAPIPLHFRIPLPTIVQGSNKDDSTTHSTIEKLIFDKSLLYQSHK